MLRLSGALLPRARVGEGLWRGRAEVCGDGWGQVELQRAIRGWYAGKVERPMQLRLVAKERQQRVGPLDDQFD